MTRYYISFAMDQNQHLLNQNYLGNHPAVQNNQQGVVVQPNYNHVHPQSLGIAQNTQNLQGNNVNQPHLSAGQHPVVHNMNPPKEMSINDAINFINDKTDTHTLRKLEKLFIRRLKEKEGLLELECESIFYILRVKLKKHSYFETADCIKYRDLLVEKINDLESHNIEQFKQSKKTPIDKAQFKAFYNIMEYYFSALEEMYDELNFHHAKEIIFEEKMKYRQHKYFSQHNYKSWFAYFMFQITSLYGNSMGRWFFTSIFTVGMFALVFFLIDEFTSITERIVNITTTGHIYDYFYYSIVTFTTLGYGDILPITVLQKVFVSFEVVIGYFMLGMLMNLIGKKV